MAATCPPCAPVPRDLTFLWIAATLVAFWAGWAASAWRFRGRRVAVLPEPVTDRAERSDRSSPSDGTDRPLVPARRLLGRAPGAARGHIVEA